MQLQYVALERMRQPKVLFSANKLLVEDDMFCTMIHVPCGFPQSSPAVVDALARDCRSHYSNIYIINRLVVCYPHLTSRAVRVNSRPNPDTRPATCIAYIATDFMGTHPTFPTPDFCHHEKYPLGNSIGRYFMQDLHPYWLQRLQLLINVSESMGTNPKAPVFQRADFYAVTSTKDNPILCI